MNKKFLFVAALAVAAFVQAVELTPEEYQDFKFYQAMQWKQRLADEKNSSTAVKWHGAIVSTVTDLEKMVTVYTYEDGWTLEVKASPIRPSPKTPEEIKAARARKKAELAKRVPLAAAENLVAREFDPVEEKTVDVVVTPQSVEDTASK